ncbi:MAG: MgtC/SapB family protein [Proteobacteria bacterium]|nr:MgtC/SapB family protein [Pseudomonadota bacterium]
MPEIDNIELILRLVIAATFGGLIGLERQIQGQSAGFRTQLLVCLGACLFTIISLKVYLTFGQSADPGRISAQIVVGIGFLGAGAILRQGEFIRGLTTAATLWTVSAIGMAIGFGEYLIASVGTILVLANLIILKHLESKIPRDRYVNVIIETLESDETDYYSLAKDSNVEIVGKSFKYLLDKELKHYNLNVKYKKEREINTFLRKLREIKGLRMLMLD